MARQLLLVLSNSGKFPYERGEWVIFRLLAAHLDCIGLELDHAPPGVTEFAGHGT